MLMRQISSKEDPDLFTTMSSSGAITNGAGATIVPRAPAVEYHPQTDETVLSNDDNNTTLDDVWGDDGDDNNNNNDDIWGDGDDSHPHSRSHENCNHNHGSGLRGSHPSDIPRLQQEHTTAGYRDGITVAKAEHVQAGFDEGFGLGATIGAVAGQLLGVLEGLVFALGSSSKTSDNNKDGELKESLKKLLAEAEKDLGVQSIYGKEYWDEDGTWRYEVSEESTSLKERHHYPEHHEQHQTQDGRPELKEAEAGEGEKEGEEEAEILFPDVALAHPLIKKWDQIIRQELAETFGLVWDVALLLPRSEEDEHEDDHDIGHGHGHGVKGEEEKKNAKPVRATSQALAW